MTHDHSHDHTELPSEIEIRGQGTRNFAGGKRTGRPGGARCTDRYL